ncbi:MAG: hypothetical protein UF067_04360, partial [Paludibacteraceae bacterium]|nr:hypothetical protein [Paludibacteraceae bacterium]
SGSATKTKKPLVHIFSINHKNITLRKNPHKENRRHSQAKHHKKNQRAKSVRKYTLFAKFPKRGAP